jgi:hypothetical protein
MLLFIHECCLLLSLICSATTLCLFSLPLSTGGLAVVLEGATFKQVQAVAVDAEGFLYTANLEEHVIYKADRNSGKADRNPGALDNVEWQSTN